MRMSTPATVEADLGWALAAVMRTYLRATGTALGDVPGGPRGYQVLTACRRDESPTQLALARRLGFADLTPGGGVRWAKMPAAARLPLELRRMVYAYLYESEAIHLTVGEKKDKLGRREQRFGNFICTQQHIGTCTCRVVVAGSALETSLPALDAAQLGLARCCRRRCVTLPIPTRLRVETRVSCLRLRHAN